MNMSILNKVEIERMGFASVGENVFISDSALLTFDKKHQANIALILIIFSAEPLLKCIH